MRHLPIVIALVSAGAVPASAQDVVTSAGPDRTSITIYRDPDRSGGDQINRRFLNGFALVTETRTIAVPAGRATIRFEGVSAGILSESAIVTGLPSDVTEKNLDADLLSPRSLYDRSLGRRVLIRRTDAATGRVREEQAVIRSGADGAAILQTADGFEALRCSGLNETLVHDRVPPGLSAKPTLSIETESPTARRVTIQLSYLAGGFDWQANYVVNMQRDGTARMFGWVTLASTDVTSHVDADTQVVAGRLNRTSDYGRTIGSGGPLLLQCWSTGPSGPFPPPPPPPMMAPAPALEMQMRAADIVVTGSRISRMVQQEELGDLKLYRVPQPTTVAANAQKQVALLDRTGVRLKPVYVVTVEDDQLSGTALELRAENRAASGLGLPLPAGPVALFEDTDVRPILIGEDSIEDVPIGQDVELSVAGGPGVTPELTVEQRREDEVRYLLAIANANPWPIDFEAELPVADGARITGASARLVREDGVRKWVVRVAANGTASLRYRVRSAD